LTTALLALTAHVEAIVPHTCMHATVHIRIKRGAASACIDRSDCVCIICYAWLGARQAESRKPRTARESLMTCVRTEGGIRHLGTHGRHKLAAGIITRRAPKGQRPVSHCVYPAREDSPPRALAQQSRIRGTRDARGTVTREEHVTREERSREERSARVAPWDVDGVGQYHSGTGRPPGFASWMP